MAEERLFQGGNLSIKDILGSRSFKNRLASEWVEDAFNRLREGEDFLFHDLSGGLKICVVSPDESRVTLSGQKSLPEGVVGFNAGFISGELRMLSVFAFLRDRLVWITEEVSRREKFHQASFQE